MTKLPERTARIIDNIRIAQSAGLHCCVICGELIAGWNPAPPRYAMHDDCDKATRCQDGMLWSTALDMCVTIPTD